MVEWISTVGGAGPALSVLVGGSCAGPAQLVEQRCVRSSRLPLSFGVKQSAEEAKAAAYAQRLLKACAGDRETELAAWGCHLFPRRHTQGGFQVDQAGKTEMT